MLCLNKFVCFIRMNKRKLKNTINVKFGGSLVEHETAEHVVQEWEKWETHIMEMMQVILTEMKLEINEMVERTGREWMVLLLGLCGETGA